MKWAPSPNFDARRDEAKVAYVVLHYTGMPTASEALERMTNPDAKVSAHYMIDEDGGTTQLVDEANRAWHAGQSFWRGQTDINSCSIGIELVNKGHAFGYTPFPSPQITALKALLKSLFGRYNLPPSALLAHSDIAPERKEDPGELFPWEELAKDGFGLWPTPPLQKETRNNTEQLLTEIGYDTRTQSATAASQQAFLRRYHPERLHKGWDEESTARLQTLARLFR